VATNFRDFERRVRRRVQEITSDDVNDFVRTVSLKLMQGIMTRSPVDTGRFRGNWHLSITAPSRQQFGALDKSGRATLQRETRKLDDLPQYPLLFYQNNLPYAERLENGWSAQAPTGMVAVSLVELTNFVTGPAPPPPGDST